MEIGLTFGDIEFCPFVFSFSSWPRCFSACCGFSTFSGLEGKGKKERNLVPYFSDFCFSQASFSATASAYLAAASVWLLVVSLSYSVVSAGFKVAAAASQLGCKQNVAAATFFAALLAAAHVFVFKSVLELGFALVIFVKLGGAFNIRVRAAAAAAWYAWSAAAIALMYMPSFVFGFFKVVVITLEELYDVWEGAAAFLVCCNKMTAAATVCPAFVAAAFWGSLVLVVDQVVVSVGILGVCAGVSWLCANGHVLGLRVLFRCDITSMSQRDVLEMFQDALACATPRVDGDAAMSGHRESLWLGNPNKSDGRRKEKEGKEEKESTDERVFIRSLNGRTHTLLLSPLDDVSTLPCLVEDLIHIPRHLWYVRTNGRPLPGPSLHHGLSRDDVLTVHARLAEGALPPRVPGEWFCKVCQWRVLAGESVLFFDEESEAMDTPHVVPPRERQCPGRVPAHWRSAGCTTERRPSPQGARKPNGLGNDKGAICLS